MFVKLSCPFESQCTEEQCAIWIKPGDMNDRNGNPCKGMCAIKAIAMKTSNALIQITEE